MRGAPFSVRGRVYLTAGAATRSPASRSACRPRSDRSISAPSSRSLTSADPRRSAAAHHGTRVPTQIRGVRLDLQRLAIAVDRPRMVLNPSNCAAQGGVAQFGSAQGQSATQRSRTPRQAARRCAGPPRSACASAALQPDLRGARSPHDHDDDRHAGRPGQPAIGAGDAPGRRGDGPQGDHPAAVRERGCGSGRHLPAVGAGRLRDHRDESAVPRPVGAAIFLVKVRARCFRGSRCGSAIRSRSISSDHEGDVPRGACR